MIVNQIQGGRWDNLLRKIFPIKDRSVAPVLASELVPYVTVQEWEDELFWARDERMAWGATNQPAVALRLSHVQLFNPAGSQTLITLDHIIVAADGDQRIRVAYLNELLAGFQNEQSGFRDQRFSTTVNPRETTGQLTRDDSLVAQGTQHVMELQLLTGTSETFALRAVIPPGSSVIIVSVAVNTNLDVNWLWRERAAEPSELT